jgi:hypothetical protein
MKKAKAIAATPEAPTTLGTTIRPAPLLEEAALGELPDLAVDVDVVVSGFEDVLEGVEPVDSPLTEVEGAADPLISA